jgi:hypothetical protein
MALKTINFDRRIGVAALTEVGTAGVHAAGTLAGVAVNAGFQTVLPGAHPAAQGVVALVLEQLHVVAPHESRVRHTLPAARGLNHRLGHAAAFGCSDVMSEQAHADQSQAEPSPRHCERSAAIHICGASIWIAALRSQ